jgi:PTS system galactitol-specific IIB component
MTTIVLACGSGIATSTAVATRVREVLDENGYAGDYDIVQCSVSEVESGSVTADLLIATTDKPEGISCAFVSGIPFLTGVERDAAERAVLDFMEERR